MRNTSVRKKINDQQTDEKRTVIPLKSTHSQVLISSHVHRCVWGSNGKKWEADSLKATTDNNRSDTYGHPELHKKHCFQVAEEQYAV